MCCDCCILGKAAQEQGLSCDLSLSVGYQCGLVYHTCCLNGAPDNQIPPTGQSERRWKINSYVVDYLISGLGLLFC